MAFNQRGSGQRALRRDRGDRGGTYGALHATARPDRNHQGPHQLPLVASGGMTLKNSSAGFGITHQSWSTRTVVEQHRVDVAFDLKYQGLLVLDGFDDALAGGGAGGEETCEDPDKEAGEESCERG